MKVSGDIAGSIDERVDFISACGHRQVRSRPTVSEGVITRTNETLVSETRKVLCITFFGCSATIENVYSKGLVSRETVDRLRVDVGEHKRGCGALVVVNHKRGCREPSVPPSPSDGGNAKFGRRTLGGARSKSENVRYCYPDLIRNFIREAIKTIHCLGDFKAYTTRIPLTSRCFSTGHGPQLPWTQNKNQQKMGFEYRQLSCGKNESTTRNKNQPANVRYTRTNIENGYTPMRLSATPNDRQ